MTDARTLPPPALLHIAQVLNLPMQGTIAVISLLDEGGTVPFIARYRKEVTGNLDEIFLFPLLHNVYVDGKPVSFMVTGVYQDVNW